jgi:hypothetical protein
MHYQACHPLESSPLIPTFSYPKISSSPLSHFFPYFSSNSLLFILHYTLPFCLLLVAHSQLDSTARFAFKNVVGSESSHLPYSYVSRRSPLIDGREMCLTSLCPGARIQKHERVVFDTLYQNVPRATNSFCYSRLF